MPYIKEEDRGKYNTYIRSISNQINRLGYLDRLGHVNYVITELLLKTLPFNRYSNFIFAKVLLEDVMQELERRLQHPYEDQKIEENGDVFLLP